MTRRCIGKLALGPFASAVFAKVTSRLNGVLVGIQGWSFRDRSLDEALAATREIGASSWELGFNHVEPTGLSRPELRKWRLSVPLEEFRAVRTKFDANGIAITGYSLPVRPDFSDEEIARAFEMTRALGTNVLTTTTNVSMAARLDSFAAKAKIKVGLHNHSKIKPDEFATPDDFATALEGRSRYMGINLDIGHFLAAGFDPVGYVQKHHQRIWSLHLKDRKRNQGTDRPFGEGDTPVREILLLLRKEKYDIPAMIEWEIVGPNTVAAVRQCFEYCRKVLA